MLFFNQTAFLLGWNCDWQIIKSTCPPGLCLHCTEHFLHMLTHSSRTAHARHARVESGWLTPLHEAVYLWVRQWGQLAFRAVCVHLCSVGARFHSLTVTYFYRQGVFLSISCLLYTSCAQIHLPGRTPGGRCTPRCSRRQAGRWLARLRGLAFLAVCRRGLKRYLSIRKSWNFVRNLTYVSKKEGKRKWL